MENNFEKMSENYQRLSNLNSMFSEEDLKRGKMTRVTSDGSVLRLNSTSPCSSTLTWEKGSNALFNYKTWTFVPESCTGCTEHSHKPVKMLIADSTVDKQPFELRIGMGFTVEFFEICLKTMNLKEKSKFLVMPSQLLNYANMEKTLRREKSGTLNYSSCCGGSCATDQHEFPDLANVASCPLELEIELLELKPPGTFEKEHWELSIRERLEQAPLLKQQGTELFSKGKFDDACVKYEKAMVLLESIVISSAMIEADRELREKKVLKKCEFKDCPSAVEAGIDPTLVYELLQTCRLNFAACKLKTAEYPPVITQCSQVIQQDPTSQKALFRRAIAYSRLGRDLDLSLKDFACIRNVCNDPAVLAQVAREEALIREKVEKHSLLEKKMFEKMFE